jgi:hypothetical protein
MKNLLLCLCFLTVTGISAPFARAQINSVLSSFQCDPTSCVEQTLPTTSGTAFVSYNATCTGGIIASIEGSAKAVIGLDAPCTSPYVAKAQVTTSTTTFTDDCGDPYDVSEITTNESIVSALGATIFNLTQSIGCDNSTSGPFTTGTAPC